MSYIRTINDMLLEAERLGWHRWVREEDGSIQHIEGLDDSDHHETVTCERCRQISRCIHCETTAAGLIADMDPCSVAGGFKYDIRREVAIALGNRPEQLVHHLSHVVKDMNVVIDGLPRLATGQRVSIYVTVLVHPTQDGLDQSGTGGTNGS